MHRLGNRSPRPSPRSRASPSSGDEDARSGAASLQRALDAALGGEPLSEAFSLSLAGSAWLRSVGRSLRGAHSLLHLDLSRCSLTTLRGLDGCASLVSLNVSDNAVATLEEAFRPPQPRLHPSPTEAARAHQVDRLAPLAQLEALDLRRNPIAREGTQYRIGVLRALPEVLIIDGRPSSSLERCRAQARGGWSHRRPLFPKHRPS